MARKTGECAGGFAFALALVAATASAPGVAHAERGGPETRAHMAKILAAMEVLLPLSANEPAFRDRANSDRIARALRAVADQGREVAMESNEADLRILYLGASLDMEARETLARYESGQVEAARLFVQQLTDFCVACHSQLPSSRDSKLAEPFVSNEALAKISPEQRATVEIATRQFDTGLSTLEAVISDPSRHPAELLDAVARYLTVSIRVKNDLERPIPTLQKLAARPGLWTHLRSDIDAWIDTLKKYRKGLPEPPTLASAEAILAEARGTIQFPSDRRALVHYLLASAQLHRYLERQKEPSPDVPEAYYLLGVVEMRLNASDWIPEGAFYLETAIRAAPNSAVARRAYDLLEEETIVGWSGSGGTHVPPDVQQHLDDLRAIAYPAG